MIKFSVAESKTMCINWMRFHYGNSYIMLSKNVLIAITSSHKLEIFSHDYHNSTLAPLILIILFWKMLKFSNHTLFKQQTFIKE